MDSGDKPYVRTLTGTPPRLKAPAGTCDTHIHFYKAEAAALPGTLNPPEATVEDYRQVMRWLDIERAVVVQPNAYGDDNSVIMDAVKALGECAWAAVVVKPGIGDAELDALSRGGARAIRFMNLLGGTLTLDALEAMAPRVRPFGWSAVVQLDGTTLPEHEAKLKDMPINYVIDHCGKFLKRVMPEDDAFRSLLRLIDTGKCWVKVAAAYEFSKDGPPHFEDVGRLVRALIREAPERVIWATNWPHAAAAKLGYPDDAALMDLLLDWAPDEAVRKKLLADNPAELYGFARQNADH
jgi:D-galactarolactone isomerase